ncbi:MAG: MFS transporter [Anaerolineae bacterium]
MQVNPRQGGMAIFMAVAVGQIISVTGSALTGFALGVWVYQRTQSTMQYSLILLFTMLPSILIAPLSGALVDRWERRLTMILTDSGAALCTVLMAVLIYFERLEVWHIYGIMVINSILRGLQTPAYLASVSLLVPKEQLGRANGVLQFESASTYLLSPLMAGWLMEKIGVAGVMAIDFATFLIAISIVLAVRFPRLTISAESKDEHGSLWKEAVYGWKYIVSRPGLLGLMLLFALGNYANLITDTVLPPMLLDRTTPAVLGGVLSAGGIGMLAGTLLMSVWNGPQRRIYGVLIFKTLAGLAMMLMGIFQPVPLIGLAVVLYYFPFPVVNSCDTAIWQSKVAPEVQGRVFSIKRMLAYSMIPWAYLTAGPLADQVFKPLFAEGGMLASTLGGLWGGGAGRGVGFLIFLMGLSIVVMSLLAAFNSRVRNIEEELSDAI